MKGRRNSVGTGRKILPLTLKVFVIFDENTINESISGHSGNRGEDLGVIQEEAEIWMKLKSLAKRKSHDLSTKFPAISKNPHYVDDREMSGRITGKKQGERSSYEEDQ